MLWQILTARLTISPVDRLSLALLGLPLLAWLFVRWGSEALASHGTPSRRLESLLQRSVVDREGALPPITVLRSGRANALAFGPNRRLGRILVTSGLLRALDAGRLRMFLLHELAHLDRRHFAIRQVAIWGAAGIAIRLGSDLVSFAPSVTAMSAALILIGLTLVSIVMRRLEFDADLSAVETARQAGRSIESTTRELAEAIEIASPVADDRGGLCHPSVAARVALLRSLRDERSIRQARDRTMMTVAIALSSIAALALTTHASRLV